MGIQSSTNKFDFIQKSSSSTASSIPSSPLDIQIEHLETFILVWLDEKNIDDQNQELQKRLRKSITNLVTFDNVKSCEEWLNSRSSDEKILLITSGRFGNKIIPIIHHLTSIIGIYIFCIISENYAAWTQTYSKVRAIIFTSELLVQQISKDQIYFENIEDFKTLQIFKVRPHTRIIDSEYTSVIWYQLFIEILFSPSYFPLSPSPNQFIQILRRSISNDEQYLNLINQFEQTYHKQNAIQYLTNNTPLARIINKALREQNISILFYLRFFIFDIYNQLISNQLSSIYVYRKQLMTSQNIQNIQININNYFMLNQFLETSIKQPEFSSISQNEYQTVFIEIDAQYQDGTLPFAYVNDLSVLFMCGSIFKIISLEQNENSTWKLKLSLTGNKEFDFLNEKIIKFRKTNDLLMIAELLDQSNQSNKANIYCQQLIQQFPPNHPLIHRINNINSNIQPISLTSSKFILIDLTKDNLSKLALSMLNVLHSLTHDSILIDSNINFDQMSNKTIFIFTNSRIYPLVKDKTQPGLFFILEEDKNPIDQLQHFNNSEDLIYQLYDEVCKCYTWEINNHIRSGEHSQAVQKKELINQINKQLKDVHRTFSENNPSTISIETTIIWLKFNDNNDPIITNIQNLFKNIVSSFLIFDDPEECFSHICTDEFNHSVFIIIDDNYKEICIATLQTLNNIKKIYRYNQSSSIDDSNNVCSHLIFDLINHYNQLANQCENTNDLDNAKDIHSKVCELFHVIMETINNIQFNRNLFSQFNCSVVILYQTEGVSLHIPLSNVDLLTFIEPFDEISACQDCIKRNDRQTFILFTYCNNIETWLWNNNPIPDNLEEIIIFCPFSSDIQFYRDWARRFTRKVIDIITFDQLERQLLIFGTKYIGNLCSNLKGDDKTRQLLEKHQERIHLALINLLRQTVNNTL